MFDETDAPRDVLAAEGFALPAPDPQLRRDEVHDVLAAEEFALPSPDPQLRVNAQPLALPPDPKDPAGTEPAHDVLAAEEFALPGPPSHPGVDAGGRTTTRRRTASRVLMALAGAGAILGRRGRRRRASGA